MHIKMGAEGFIEVSPVRRPIEGKSWRKSATGREGELELVGCYSNIFEASAFAPLYF